MGILNIVQDIGRGSFFNKQRRSVRNGTTNAKPLLRLQDARRLRKSIDRETEMPIEKCFQPDPLHGAEADDDDDDSDSDGAPMLRDTDLSLKEILALEQKKKAANENQPVVGNLYKKWAFFGLGCKDGITSSIGQIFIFIIQVIAPAAMCAWYVLVKIDWDATGYSTDHWTGSGHAGWVFALIMVLFMYLFYFNASNSNADEEQNWKYSKLLYEVVDAQTHDVGNSCWLWMGALVNCQALIFLCIDTWLLMYTCGGPGDVVMNIVGLIFLYKMDDLDSDLVFLGPSDWDSAVMGDILWSGINQYETFGFRGLDGFNEKMTEKFGDLDDPDNNFEFAAAAYDEAVDHAGICNPIYTITHAVICLLTLALPPAYLFIEIKMKD